MVFFGHRKRDAIGVTISVFFFRFWRRNGEGILIFANVTPEKWGQYTAIYFNTYIKSEKVIHNHLVSDRSLISTYCHRQSVFLTDLWDDLLVELYEGQMCHNLGNGFGGFPMAVVHYRVQKITVSRMMYITLHGQQNCKTRKQFNIYVVPFVIWSQTQVFGNKRFPESVVLGSNIWCCFLSKYKHQSEDRT